MNLLAHAHLSFGHSQVLVGNMISDFVKGKKQYEYPPEILIGIKLHRAIDHFTDTHLVTQKMKTIFRPTYRLYSGAFVDVVYDHFLANDSNEFKNDNNLFLFSNEVYNTLAAYKNQLPAVMQNMLPHMQSQNWLYNYKHNWGIQKSFGGVVKRATYLFESDIAFELFENNYEFFKINYELFFPELKNYATQYLENLLTP
jgi:acyl carrier protein phosphodiesterase